MFALIDCNNFYASCERVFNPALENKPIVVLSNNDGCIISRSNEAKQLNIPMGAPFFKWKGFCEKKGVHVFSSNYELYGDMSQRVMAILQEFNEAIEVYSIDEAFLSFNREVTFTEMIELRKKVKKWTGIPISIGIGETKTLAKAANQLAKSKSNHVFILSESTMNALVTFPVEKIWGIGYRLAEKIKSLGIQTAAQLRAADSKMIRLHFSVTVEKTVQELNGISCLELEKFRARKQIISSRSFGKKVTELSDLEEAVSHYTTLAAKKLRKQHSVAAAIQVYLQANLFKDNHPQYGNAVTFPFSVPTADTRYLIQAAKKCLQRIYKKNYQYHKAGIALLDITPEQSRQYDLLTEVVNKKSEAIMKAMDSINANMGKNTIFLAAEGIERSWLIRCDRRSPRYTTRWEELPVVFG